ncbi:MAG: T9SS type A sorting domain-containing protein [Ginsengibacter sp.]
MKIRFLPVLFSFALLVCGSRVNAQGGTLPLNNSVNGNLTSATPDVWDITTTSDGLLRLTFTTVSPADLYVTLFDNDGTTALSSQTESFNNSTVTVTVDGLAPGTYHAKIIPFGTSFGHYTLADSLFTTPLANDAEPNGTTASAVVLPQNGSKTGHVGYYYNHLRDTADWYKVTTTADGLLRVYLATDSGSKYSTNTGGGTNPLDVNLDLYDNDGITNLGHAEVFNGYGKATNLITADGLAPGTYYIKVQNFSTAQFANYTISDTLFTTPLANDVEPNGNIAGAVVLPQNGSKTGHVGYYYNHLRDTADWYKVTTTADGLLRVYLKTDSGSVHSTNTGNGTNPLDVNLDLYDNDGTTNLGHAEVFNGYGKATNLITADGLAPGTYYIKVQNFSTAQFANYTISDTLFTTPLANDVEPNGTIAGAIVLPLNGSKTGHVGYYYNHLRDTADWYKVTTTADGLLRVYLKTDSGSVHSTNTGNGTNPLDVNLDLFDNDGITPLGHAEVFNGYGKATNLITADGLAPGTYYIRVRNFSTAEFANYTISDSFFLTPVISDVEPNGATATAINLPINSNVTGHVGYYYNHLRDTADWYKVTTASTGPLRLVLQILRAGVYSTYGGNGTNPLDFNLFLYSSDGTTLLGQKEVFKGYDSTRDSLVLATLAAGTYYIRIQPFSTTEFGNYKLAVLNASGVVLPVTFLNFDGVLLDNQALLSWSTATELNNKGFEVEKSTDGRTFKGMGFVNGAGNLSLVNHYNYTDIKVLSGYNYYRLKQEDIDGHFGYSSVIRLDFKYFDWAIFGNPVTTNSWIQLQLAKTSNVAIQIFSIEGKVIQTINKGTISQGTYSIPLNLGNAPSGIYIVKLITDNQSFSKKVIK